MASTTASAGRSVNSPEVPAIAKRQIWESIRRLSGWLEKNEYRGYDTFDGLNSKYLRPLTFETNLLRTVLQQGVRRFPINLRPILGISKDYSSKGMGFLARGFIRLHKTTGDTVWADKARFCLQWLQQNAAKGYSGFAWGNHFDYQSRSFYLPKGEPTIVWTSLIGHAFLDAYDHFHNEEYLQTAVGACEHILNLDRLEDDDTVCISYIPSQNKQVHNSNTLGASLLARTYAITGSEDYRALAEKAIKYTAKYQRQDGSWYYGEKENLHWVDNFHTAYVLDCFQYYKMFAKDNRFDAALSTGYEYWKRTFFLPDGTPRYYNHKSLPIDIQCSSQAIDTLVFFNQRDPENLSLALRVAQWTIENMQDRTGYFYYRRYSKWLVNKTPTLHWGQATMLCALSGLYNLLWRDEV